MRTLDEIKAGPLRLYSFVNYYLSDLQRGLQTAHLVSELFINYDRVCSPMENNCLHYWAHNNKTIIILNGGNCKSLFEINSIIHSKGYPYPHERFYEDKDSLNGALTCVGLVFPEFTKQDVDDYADVADGTDNFIDLMRLIRSCPLA